MNIQWLGTIDYEEALVAQDKAYGNGFSGYLCFEVPEHTITLGRSANLEDEIITPESFKVISTDRGGKATLHSPGQLVVFPVLDLKSSNIRPKDLVEKLLDNFNQCLVGLGVPSKQHCQGLYTKAGKIAFIGLRIKDKKVYHGLSFNTVNDLSVFSNIRSCGVEQASHDAIINYVTSVGVKDLALSLGTLKQIS